MADRLPQPCKWKRVARWGFGVIWHQGTVCSGPPPTTRASVSMKSPSLATACAGCAEGTPPLSSCQGHVTSSSTTEDIPRPPKKETNKDTRNKRRSRGKRRRLDVLDLKSVRAICVRSGPDGTLWPCAAKASKCQGRDNPFPLMLNVPPP